MKIISFDPGGTTGVAAYDSQSKKFDGLQLGNIEHHEELYILLETVRPTEIVYERFVHRMSGAASNLIPMEYIGVIKLYAQQNDLVITPQMAGPPKNLWKRANIVKLGLWVTGRDHQMDALRHLLYYMAVTLNNKELLIQGRV